MKPAESSWGGTRILLWIVGVYSLSRLVLVYVGANAGRWLVLNPVFDVDRGLWGMWARFDSTRYLEIANSGYSLGYMGPAGWFPGYPVLVRLFHWWGDVLPSALLVSNLACLGALYFVFLLARMDFGESAAKKAILVYLAFPSAFLFSCVYAESTFLFFSCGAYWCLRTGRWRWAAVLLALATSTRMVGLALLPAFCWEAGQEYRDNPNRILSLTLAPAAVVGFFWYLHVKLGNFFLYVKTQNVFGRTLGVWANYSKHGRLLLEHKVGLGFLALEGMMLAFLWKTLRPSYRIYVLFSLAMTLYHVQGLAAHRFTLVLFPLFIALGVRMSIRYLVPWIALSSLGQAMLFAAWVQGYTATY